MKRIISLFAAALILTTAAFADIPGDEYDDGYAYDQNGAGDQFLKFDFSGCFPITGANSTNLFHKGQLSPGVAFDLGYYRFLTTWFAVGGEVTFTSNWSIGEKLQTTVPILGGVLFQPIFGNFELPVYLNVGISHHSWANNKYFPGFTVKTSAGLFYRITEAWSVGATGSFIWLPEWFKDSSKNMNGMLVTANIGGRFHF